MFKHITLLLFITTFALIGSIFGQTAVVTLRPSHVDLSTATSYGAVLVTLSSYTNNTARYRLFNGSNQYNCWDDVSNTFISSNSYASGPLVKGTPTTSSTFWIIYQRGTNNSVTASYRDRLSTYTNNYQTVALTTATAIASPFTLSGTLTAVTGYDLTQRYVVLGFDAESGGTLLCATTTELTTGTFSLVCHGGHNVKRVEVRTITNVLLSALKNSSGWTATTNLGTNPLPVELTSFTASAKGTSVTLNWETKTEVDNNGFEVERNTNGNWQKIGFVEGHGTANSPKYYSFVDNSAIGNKIQYRLRQIDNDGTFEYSPEVEVELNPTTFALYQNYPNPFNPSTIIRFSMPVNGNVALNVFNTLGEKVATLLNGQMEAGYHEVSFDAKNLPSGLYFYEIKAGDFSSIKKMILIK